MAFAICTAADPTEEDPPQTSIVELAGVYTSGGRGNFRLTNRAMQAVANAIGNIDPSAKDIESGILDVAISRSIVYVCHAP
jgi:hypothetical protein